MCAKPVNVTPTKVKVVGVNNRLGTTFPMNSGRKCPAYEQNFVHYHISPMTDGLSNKGNAATLIATPKASKDVIIIISSSKKLINKSPASMGFLDTKYIDILQVPKQKLDLHAHFG